MSHAEHYSQPNFWNKLRSSTATASRGVAHKALCLYYAYGAPTTPTWAKAAIAGALGYFILPLDAVPDVLAGIGYTDDLAVLALALTTVAMHVTPEHVERAKTTLAKRFAVLRG